jgi:hypothetical protein
MPAYCNAKENIMKNMVLKAAVLGALGLVSVQAAATGLVNIPDTGFAVGSDTSPYTLCNTTGNFGSDDDALAFPTTSSNNTCAVFPANQNTAPESGYSLIASSTRNIILNDSAHTNNTNVTVGSVVDRIWRNSSTNECIYGARVTMSNVDYDLNTAGTQYIEFNDVVRSGFSGRSVSAGYYRYTSAPVADGVVYRIGRTNVSVQHRADLSDESAPASGYVAQPLTSPTPANTPINGVEAWDDTTLPVPDADEQSATLGSDYVDFTTDLNYLDDDGGNSRNSSYLYVKSTCSSSTASTSAGALSFRQTAQEESPWITINITGYVPN